MTKQMILAAILMMPALASAQEREAPPQSNTDAVLKRLQELQDEKERRMKNLETPPARLLELSRELQLIQEKTRAVLARKAGALEARRAADDHAMFIPHRQDEAGIAGRACEANAASLVEVDALIARLEAKRDPGNYAPDFTMDFDGGNPLSAGLPRRIKVYSEELEIRAGQLTTHGVMINSILDRIAKISISYDFSPYRLPAKVTPDADGAKAAKAIAGTLAGLVDRLGEISGYHPNDRLDKSKSEALFGKEPRMFLRNVDMRFNGYDAELSREFPRGKIEADPAIFARGQNRAYLGRRDSNEDNKPYGDRGLSTGEGVTLGNVAKVWGNDYKPWPETSDDEVKHLVLAATQGIVPSSRTQSYAHALQRFLIADAVIASAQAELDGIPGRLVCLREMREAMLKHRDEMDKLKKKVESLGGNIPQPNWDK